MQKNKKISLFMDAKEYLEKYEDSLAEHLVRMLSIDGKLDGRLLTTDDFYQKWNDMAPSYCADSIKEIADYPLVSLGWAMYLGLAVAKYWDDEWEIYSKIPNLYEYIRDKRGYDNMDDYIKEEVLGLSSEESARTEQLVQTISQQVLARIRHEQIEPQSPMAYHVYLSSVKVLFHIGASVELKLLGYNLDKVNL